MSTFFAKKTPPLENIAILRYDAGVRYVEKLLLVVVAFLLAIIAASTIWAFHKRGAVDDASAASAPQAVVEDTVRTFNGIGRQRLSLKAKNGDEIPLVITAVFPYDASDATFAEELARGVPRFRVILKNYFGALPPDAPVLKDEAQMKEALLKEFNAILRTGKIAVLYFSEFFVLE